MARSAVQTTTDRLSNVIVPSTTTIPKPLPAGHGEVDPSLMLPDIVKLRNLPDGYCGCGMDMDNYDGTWQLTDIWLDLIFILDVSEGMADAVKEVSLFYK